MFLLIFVVQDLLLNMPEYKNNINSKLPFIGVSIFARMSALANQYKAINLSQGFPDFDIDDKLIERVRHYMKTGHNQYAPFQGVAELRKAIAEKVRITTGREYDWQDEVNITAGATQAINTAISCFVRDGDEVIIFEPAYDSYAPSVEMCNGKVRQVNYILQLSVLIGPK
ncbi:MAG: aminotransferase class I/II-fold pyridoxal phosphate-dependent enzyme [Deltaproteobacteria bacterium]